MYNSTNHWQNWVGGGTWKNLWTSEDGTGHIFDTLFTRDPFRPNDHTMVVVLRKKESTTKQKYSTLIRCGGDMRPAEEGNYWWGGLMGTWLPVIPDHTNSTIWVFQELQDDLLSCYACVRTKPPTTYDECVAKHTICGTPRMGGGIYSGVADRGVISS